MHKVNSVIQGAAHRIENQPLLCSVNPWIESPLRVSYTAGGDPESTLMRRLRVSHDLNTEHVSGPGQT